MMPSPITPICMTCPPVRFVAQDGPAGGKMRYRRAGTAAGDADE
jgi:hypothetical protein